MYIISLIVHLLLNIEKNILYIIDYYTFVFTESIIAQVRWINKNNNQVIRFKKQE